MGQASWELVEGVRGTTLVLAGDFDLLVEEDLRDQLRTALAVAHSQTYVDVSGVTFCDSSGLAQFLWAQRRAPSYGTELVLVRPSPAFALLLDAAGLDDFFSVTTAN